MERILRIVIRYQEKDETLYAKIYAVDPLESNHNSYNELCNAILRHNYVLHRIGRIYVFDKYGQKIALRDSFDVNNVVEREDLFTDTVYVEPCGVVREDPRTEAFNKRVWRIDPSPTWDTNLNNHEGVVCGVCNGPIIGFRYRCTQCQDFSLCMSCERKMHHHQHRLVRFAESNTNAERKFLDHIRAETHDGPSDIVPNRDQQQPKRQLPECDLQKMFKIAEMAKHLSQHVYTLGLGTDKNEKTAKSGTDQQPNGEVLVESEAADNTNRAQRG